MSKLFNDDFVDALSIVGFIIGVLNYEENLSQSDKDDIIKKSSQDAEKVLKQLEKDLEDQNVILREIIERLDRLEKEK